MKHKKGQAISLGKAPALVMLITFIVMIGGAVGLALNSFYETQCRNDGYYYNTTTLGCELNVDNATHNQAGSYAVNSTVFGLRSLSNVTSQIPTVGTVIGVALIVVVVIGAFAFFIGKGKGAL